jgi:hypothetical protein
MGVFCMVERSRELSQLNQITDALNNLNEKVSDPNQPPKKEEFASLIKILQNYNNVGTNTDPRFWEDKKFEQDATIEESIEQALNAVLNFQKVMHQPPSKVARNVREMIISLYAQFEKDKEYNKFKTNIENLKEKWKRLKQKTEGTEQSNLGKGS